MLRLPVYAILNDSSTGSGFYLQDNSNVYFVTARHVLVKTIVYNKASKKDSIIFNSKNVKCISYSDNPIPNVQQILHIDLIESLKNESFLTTRLNDLCAIKIGKLTKINEIRSELTFEKSVTPEKTPQLECIPLSIIQNYNECKVGDDVFIFGYPNSIGIKQSPQFDSERPLLRKGIIAGKYDKQKTIILDCPSYYGNSGGPVIVKYIENDSTKYRTIGVVSELIPYVEDWYNLKNGLINTSVSNSGYSVIVPLDFLKDLLKK